MKQIFDNYVENSFDGVEQAKFKLRQFDTNYRKLFPAQKAAEVLDIGIGRGEMLTCMRDWGYTYQGIDISPSTVALCKSLQLNCLVVDDTARWLQGCSKKFSLITCLDVLEHVPREQVIGFLHAIRSSLQEQGQAIIQVPNLQSPFGYLHHFNDFTHVSGFVEHSLRQVLLAAGFKQIQFFGFEEIYRTGPVPALHKLARHAFRSCVRFLRRLNGNPNPKILAPVMYVVAR